MSWKFGPAANYRVSPMEMSSGSELSFSFCGDWDRNRSTMHGLSESGWPGRNRSGGGGGAV